MIRRALLLLLLAMAPARAQDFSEPRNNRIYAAQDGIARIAVAPQPGIEWQITEEASGNVVRPWAPSQPPGFVEAPIGGWYRLQLRQAGQDAGLTIGGRFAVGMVILITGQSQAEAMFHAGFPIAGAFAPDPRDPAQPEPSAVLTDCGGPQPWCAGDFTFWDPAPQGLGARLLLAELHRRWRMPVGLINAATGGASAAQLADAMQPPGNRLARLSTSAGRLNGAVILGHGTTDTFFPPTPEAFAASMRQIVTVVRAAGPPGMPVLMSLLPPLERPARLLGSRQLAQTMLPNQRDHWLAWIGLLQSLGLDDFSAARAETLRGLQRQSMTELGLRDGGDLRRVTPGLDGIHWSEQGVREAARVTAAALIAQVQPARRR